MSTGLAQAAVVLVAVLFTLVLTAAQLRVARRPAPRGGAYAIAWTVCVTLIGGFLTVADHFTGARDAAQTLQNFSIGGGVSAAGLLLGGWLVRQEVWQGARTLARTAMLLALEGVVVAVAVRSFY